VALLRAVDIAQSCAQKTISRTSRNSSLILPYHTQGNNKCLVAGSALDTASHEYLLMRCDTARAISDGADYLGNLLVTSVANALTAEISASR
jgi:hypothetical protein